MDLLLFLICLVAGGILSLVIQLKPHVCYQITRMYIVVSLIVIIVYWMFYFSGLTISFLLSGFKIIITAGKLLLTFTLGFLVVTILSMLKRPQVAIDPGILKKILSNAVWGLTILTGSIFLIATVGKLTNFANMSAFFTSSGYSVKFLYFIMVMETLGGIGILLNFKLKTGVLAASGLAIIMLGAIYTHWHNRDPFSDCYAAIIQLINLLLLQILYNAERIFRLRAHTDT